MDHHLRPVPDQTADSYRMMLEERFRASVADLAEINVTEVDGIALVPFVAEAWKTMVETLERVDVKAGDLLIVRGTDVEATQSVAAAIAKVAQQCSMVVALVGNDKSIESFDERAMAACGWVRTNV